jgi:DNA modification methylase
MSLPAGALLIGDARDELRELASNESVQTCVTSPPYFKQRTYSPGNPLEIGQEETVDAYVANLVQVFREVRRVLRDDGTCWLNLNDTFLSGELAGAPWRVALALQADGWRLACDVIWNKPNVLPCAARNRPTRSHEYLFLFSKSPGYFYDQEAIREPWTSTHPNDFARARAKHPGYQGKHASGSQARGFTGAPKGDPDKGRNKRTVWTHSAPRFKGAHFATMPEAIAETCILAGSRPGDVVLDPFAGAGTTLAAAQKLGRRWLGVELEPAYESLIRDRLTAAPSQDRVDESGARAESPAGPLGETPSNEVPHEQRTARPEESSSSSH